MELSPLLETDLEEISALKPDGWRDLKEIHRFYISRDFCHPLKMTEDGRIVGIGTGIRNGGTGWLAHIIVSEERRGEGIGGRIVASLMELLAGDPSCSTVSLIATDLGYPLYLKHGFAVQTEYAVHSSLEAGRERSAGDSIRPMEKRHLADVCRLDRIASGEDRSRLLSLYVDGSFVCVAGGRAVGFYMPKLGEGLAIAEQAEAGLELLRLRLIGTKKVVLPAANAAARAFLEENGFPETGRLKRMIFGPAFPWQPENIYSRIAGNLG